MAEPVRYDALVEETRIHASLYTDPRIVDDEMAAEPLPNLSFLI